MVDFFVLLNSGDFVLLNDGTSKVILNSTADNGVIVQGIHATQLISDPKRKLKQYELTAGGQISRVSILTATGKIQRLSVNPVTAKLSRISENVATSKITRLYEMVAKGTSYHKIKSVYTLGATAQIFAKDHTKETQYYHKKQLDKYVKESKVSKLRKIFDLYKEEAYDDDE